MSNKNTSFQRALRYIADNAPVLSSVLWDYFPEAAVTLIGSKWVDGNYNPPETEYSLTDAGRNALAAYEAQQQSIKPVLDVMLNEDTPHVPAQLDAFLSGDTMKSILDQDTMSVKEWRALAEQMKAHELHEADGSEIERLRFENANLRSADNEAKAMITEKNARIQQLKALLAESKQVCAPFAESVTWDSDVQRLGSSTLLGVECDDGTFTYIRGQDGLLRVRHLRAVAAFLRKLP